MSYTIIPPPEELRNLISHFWLAKWDEQAVLNHSTYYLTANSLTEMAFAFQGQELLFSSVQGQTSKPAQFPASGFYELFGVSFHSFAIPFLLDFPASELSNSFLSPETILGKDGRVLTEKIALADSTSDRVHILADYFRSRLRKQKAGDQLICLAVQKLRQYQGNFHISELARDCCLSQKQFERRFKAATGFNPKLYARIVRFETSLNNYSRFPSLTAAAHANGYYDQAHFIHEFKAFSGYSPAKFFTLSGY